MCSPGPFSGANCLIINDGRCQVNFTKARFDSIRPVENLSKDDCGKPTLRSGASSPLSKRELSLNGCTFVRRIQALFCSMAQISIFVICRNFSTAYGRKYEGFAQGLMVYCGPHKADRCRAGCCLARQLLLRNEPAAPRKSASKLASSLGLHGYSETGRTDCP